jgi:hypothetical protein
MPEDAVLDAPVEIPSLDSSSSESPETVAGESPTPDTSASDQHDQQDKPDKRRNPDALRKTLKWLRENGGEHSERAAEIERYLGENKSYKTVYPTVRDARETKLAVDAIGGVGKIAEMQQSVAHMAEIDSMLEAGDPKVLDEIFQLAPKGIAKLAPAILDRLAESNPQAYTHAVAPHALSFLDTQGVTDALDAMVQAFNAGKPDEAKGVLAKIVNWYKSIISSSSHTAVKPDPEREAFEKERETFSQQKYHGEVKATFDQVISHAEQTLDKHLAADRKRLGLSDESYALLREDAWKYLQSDRNADPVFKAAIGTKINDKTRSISTDAVSFLNAQTDAKAKAACDKAIRVRYGHLKATPVATEKKSPTSPPSGGTVALDPDVTRKKLGRSGAQDAILRGEGFSRDGKPIKKTNGVWKYAS